VEPPLTPTDVSLRRGGVIQGWPVPVVPWQFQLFGTTDTQDDGSADHGRLKFQPSVQAVSLNDRLAKIVQTAFGAASHGSTP